MCHLCQFFNGLNFSYWNEQVQFHLDVLDLDLAILEEKPATITYAISNERKPIIKHGKDLTDSV